MKLQPRGTANVTVSPVVKMVRFKGREVIFIPVRDAGAGSSHVSVAGYKVLGPHPHSNPVTVEFIPKKDQQAIKAKVMQRAAGPIKFW